MFEADLIERCRFATTGFKIAHTSLSMAPLAG
jgi:hypothetical protein